ncbi:MAG: glycosyltransferase [Ignavibacteriales bacterium]|nr:glycosyltransferase [Ignavibacteriales bacterium]
MIDNILLIVFILLLINYIIFLLRIFSGLKNLKSCDVDFMPEDFVTVIIPFRNETENILHSLKSIEAQNYPKEKYEVLFVNDFSQDDSLQKISDCKKSDNIKILSVPSDYSMNAHKKRAIRFGIQNAKGKIIITTDADCNHNVDWLKSLLACMKDDVGFVSGPVEFYSNESFFSKLQKIEFAGLVITGAGLIGSGKPIICNAANIAYRKNAFDKVNGFNDQMNLSSGDDELLMQKIWKETDYKVKFCTNKKAIVETDPNRTVKQFYQQRKRWASKGLFYADKFLIVKLIFIYLFYVGLLVQLVLGIFFSIYFVFSFIISFFLKALVEFLVLKKGSKVLFDKFFLCPFPIAEIIHLPYIIIAGISGAFGNFKWKNRTVKR